MTDTNTTTLSSTTTNHSDLSSTTPFVPTTTNSSTHNGTFVHQPLIFLQTAAAQGIGGAFSILALLITVHQVSRTHNLLQNCQLDTKHFNWVAGSMFCILFAHVLTSRILSHEFYLNFVFIGPLFAILRNDHLLLHKFCGYFYLGRGASCHFVHQVICPF